MKDKKDTANSVYDKDYFDSKEEAESVIGYRATDGYVANCVALGVGIYIQCIVFLPRFHGVMRTALTILTLIAVSVISYRVGVSYYDKMKDAMYSLGHKIIEVRCTANSDLRKLERLRDSLLDENNALKERIRELEKAE